MNSGLLIEESIWKNVNIFQQFSISINTCLTMWSILREEKYKLNLAIETTIINNLANLIYDLQCLSYNTKFQKTILMKSFFLYFVSAKFTCTNKVIYTLFLFNLVGFFIFFAADILKCLMARSYLRPVGNVT